MFIQVIQGRCTKQDELRSWASRWKDEVGPGATGWLGGTFGFTDDDVFLAVVRFESRAAADANSARPEQDAWAGQLAGLLDGPPTFVDYDDVTTFLDGGSDDAGFVQVIQGQVDDPAAVKAALFTDIEALREMRPEIIGGTLAFAPDGTYTETVAFTDEASARTGESAEAAGPPPEVAEALEKMMVGARFFDLRDPWFESA